MVGAPLAVGLAAAAFGQVATAASIFRSPEHGIFEAVEMHMLRQDCGRLVNPGAGTDPSNITVGDSATILKDGYYAVDCVKDYMFEYGDKFGDHKHKYKLGTVSDVSVVHYNAHVSRQDRQPMTHEVCFRFCRTVKDMLFFGLTNGRECYCTPYYQAEAGDSSMCDAVCDGNQATVCGGKSKSSIFGMHRCADAKDNLNTATQNLQTSVTSMRNLKADVSSAGSEMSAFAGEQQILFGSAGDPGAADLMQSAKRFAGELIKGIDEASAIENGIDKLKSEEPSAQQINSAADQASIEDYLANVDLAKTRTEASIETLSSLADRAILKDSRVTKAAKTYYPATYFVDKKYANVPSTCTGTPAAEPMVASFVDDCAHACDSDVGDCEAFSFFPGTSRGLCFLMSKLKTVTFFTNCPQSSTGVGGENAMPNFNSTGSAFLQRTSMSNAAQTKVNSSGVVCAVKFSKFEGTTLSPDPSGSCKKCLNEVNRADRCFSV
jgi:hypothetical protein